MTINEMISKAGWFKGSEKAWDRLDSQTKKDLSFKHTGCEAAYPTWEKCDCVHTGCRIRRGEIPPIVLTNGILKYELSNGWLRFNKDSKEARDHLARLIRAIRRKAQETGIYDPWKIPGGWQSMVATAIS